MSHFLVGGESSEERSELSLEFKLLSFRGCRHFPSPMLRCPIGDVATQDSTQVLSSNRHGLQPMEESRSRAHKLTE